jgi:phenylalanyl-tRNA synthetase beta chain
VRAPLSWLRDFAPFPDDTEALKRALDDLGLVVEAVEQVGEGLEQVVVARVDEISAIAGADKIRRVVVESGAGPLEIVCGADNFVVGDRVPLAPVGAVLPDGSAIAQRKLKGVVSNGMLCSGRELGLSEDSAGLLVLADEVTAGPGTPITEALGLEADTVFDITVEGNRPDAWCIVGIARDLAARLGLPFTVTDPPLLAGGPPIADVATAVVEAPDFCPRLTVSVVSDVVVGPSPDWIARRLTLAGMRPINNVVDASNYVMLERGQPTHPYDRQELPGHGLIVRRARAGETLETLDGTTRALGVPGRGLGDTGEECLICDGEDNPVGIAGIMGGASSEISERTTEVLLEAAYFTPMVIARTSKRLGLRTEASARFERGCDPWGIDASVARFFELLRQSIPGLKVADGMLDVRGDVPQPFEIDLPIDRVQRQIGVALSRQDISDLIAPIGFTAPAGDSGDSDDGVLKVVVPTNRPDVRPAPYGIDDVIEEVARTFGYSNVPRHTPTWPQPGHLEPLQRSRRHLKEICNGLGLSEGWTNTFVSEELHARAGFTGPAVRVSNPLDAAEPYLRRSLLPGLLDALSYNADRRQSSLRLFEVGVVFSHPDEGAPRVERAGAGGSHTMNLPGERELLGAVFALDHDDATSAVGAWHVVAEALGSEGVRMRAPEGEAEVPAGLHPTRCARLVASTGTVVGSVGEIDPAVALAFGLASATAGGSMVRRIGWLELDLGLLFDDAVVPHRVATAGAVSRFPSADIDLALVVDDRHPADLVGTSLREAGGDLVESIALFDVYRGAGVPAGHRSLAFHLRFCAADHTLTDAEVGDLRQRCIDAVEGSFGAVLR